MVRVAALTSSQSEPASRFRIKQYIPKLLSYNVHVTDYCPIISQHARLPGILSNIRTRYLPPVVASQLLINSFLRIPGILGSYRADVLWLERCFIPGLDVLVRLTKAPRVLDVDDAVWLMNPLGEKSAGFLTRNVDAVIVGNDYLANWYSSFCKKIYVIPTAIDFQRFSLKQNSLEGASNQFIIGWTGSSSNFKYFKLVEKPLARFLADHVEAKIFIIADKRPVFEMIPENKIIFERWTPQSESSLLHQMDIGIMPLTDDDWTRGKCSFKMLQYMATGIPVIVSSVGMNKEVLAKGFCGYAAENDDDWYDHLVELYSKPALREELGRTGRSIIENNYSIEIISKQLAEVFRGFA